MDPVFGLIPVTSLIKIKRTDGRIHNAKVVQLNREFKSVGVEWKENEEIKGKEISIDLIFELNEDLKPQQTNQRRESRSNSEIRKTTFPETNQTLKASPITLDIEAVERDFDSKPPSTIQTRFLQTSRQMSVNVDSTSNQSTSTRPNTSSVTPIQRKNSLSSTENINSPSLPRASSRQSVALSTFTPAPAQASSNGSSTTHKTAQYRSRAQSSRKTTTCVQQDSVQSNPASLHGQFGQMIHDYRSNLFYNPISDPNHSHQETIDVRELRICVAVRKRPLSKREVASKDNDVITIPTKNQCIVHVPKSKVDLTKYLDNHTFKFDYSFDENTSTELIYRYTTAPLIDTVFNGGNATVFAYGQTGSGKTFTMGGDSSATTAADYSRGVYALTARDIFARLASPEIQSNIEIYVTFYEIYCGNVFDLLNNKKKLRVLEDQQGLVQVCDKKEQQVKSVQDVLNIIQDGMNSRVSGTTSANSNSSRSHAVLQLILKTTNTTNPQPKVRTPSGSSRSKQTFAVRAPTREVGKMSLIDLAGSERGKDTADGDRVQRMEGAQINKSLLALKECIRALGRGDGAHVPFRGSTLTKVLRDSFIGEKSKICMIAMISPTHSDVENTMNTLRYADRVKELRADVNDESPAASNDRDEEFPVDGEEIDQCDDGLASSDDDQHENEDNGNQQHDEVFLGLNSDQSQQRQKYQQDLFQSYTNILTSQEPTLTKELLNTIRTAQKNVNHEPEKLLNDIRTNLLRRQKIFNELQRRLDDYDRFLQNSYSNYPK